MGECVRGRRTAGFFVGVGIAVGAFTTLVLDGTAATAAERKRADATAGAATSERVVLPFACRVENGRVRLSHSRDRSHAVLGPRHEQIVVACSDTAPSVCRTLVAHRFVMSCGGKRVDWADVAVAIGGRRTSQVWADGRRLNVLVKEAVPRALDKGCGAGQGESGAAGGDAAPPAVGDARLVPIADTPCQSPEPAVQRTHFVMPERFAPLALFGARIIAPEAMYSAAAPAGSGAVFAAAASQQHPVGASMAAAVPVDAVRRESQGLSRAASTAEPAPKRRMSRLLERMILSEPLPDIVAEPRLDIASAPPAMAWAATIRRESDQPTGFAAAATGNAAGVAEPRYRELMVWLLLTSLIAAGGWLGWSHHAVALGRVQAGFGRIQEGLGRYSFGRQIAGAVNRLRVSPLSGARETSDGATYPSEAVESRMRQVMASVARVNATMPLREVLEDELGRVRQRLGASRAAGGEAGGRLGAAAYRVLLRDLDRIERIAMSAERSISGAGLFNGATRLPQTARDAYETLGINGHVSDATLKKIADALRMSWHPDLAHDDDDRVQREERIKHINLAVELIEAERRATAITAG